MSTVRLYSTSWCPFCVRAKALLRSRRVPFEELDVTDDDEGRQRLVQLSGGRRTVPQIFVGDVHVGGCDDLVALDRAGRLEPMLVEQGIPR